MPSYDRDQGALGHSARHSMLSSLLYADDGLVLDNNQPIKTRAHIQNSMSL